MNIPNTDKGICPYGDCNGIDGDHVAGCVKLKRTVVVEMKTRMVVDVPRDWDTNMIEFHFNESCHCASNEFKALAEATEPDDSYCGCSCTEITYIGEAEEENDAIDISRK